MLAHLFNLLGRSFMHIPVALGSTWLGLLSPIIIALVGEGIGALFFGVQAMKANWKRATRIGLAAIAAFYTIVFLGCVITTAYVDHTDLVSRNHELHAIVSENEIHEERAVQVVKNDLNSKLSDLREGCAKTEGASGALKQQTVDQQNTINNCQTQALKLLSPEPFKIVPIVLNPANTSIGEQHVKWLLLTNKTTTPVNLIVACNKRLTSISAEVIGGGAMLSGGNTKLSDNTYKINISSPAWGPNTPIVLELSYIGDQNITCGFNER